jgi:hypothetical protein
LHDVLGIQPAQERGLDAEHRRYLPHRVKRR